MARFRRVAITIDLQWPLGCHQHVFRSALGRTVSGEIARLRIERVKRRLVESDAPLKTLAADLGFRDDKRLCEAFRRLEGTTPGQYRSQRRDPTER